MLKKLKLDEQTVVRTLQRKYENWNSLFLGPMYDGQTKINKYLFVISLYEKAARIVERYGEKLMSNVKMLFFVNICNK